MGKEFVAKPNVIGLTVLFIREFSVEYIVLNGENFSLNQFIQGVREKKQVMLGEDAGIKVIKARETVQRALNSKRVIYGLTTGFGALSDVVI